MIDKTLAVSDRVYAMTQGRVVLEARANELGRHQRLERAYFGEAAAGSLGWAGELLTSGAARSRATAFGQQPAGRRTPGRVSRAEGRYSWDPRKTLLVRVAAVPPQVASDLA